MAMQCPSALFCDSGLNLFLLNLSSSQTYGLFRHQLFLLLSVEILNDHLRLVCMTSCSREPLLTIHIQICWQEPLRKLDQAPANGIITTSKWQLIAFRRQEKIQKSIKTT